MFELRECPNCGGEAYQPVIDNVSFERNYCVVIIGCKCCRFAIGRTAYCLEVKEINKKAKKLVKIWNNADRKEAEKE